MPNTKPPSDTHPPSGRARERFCISGDVVLLYLTRGHIALVDRADLGFVSGHTWTAVEEPNTVYARSSPGFLHRLLLGAGPGEVIDHADGNGLNNRRQNLRRCSPKENVRNAQKWARASSPYKGVWFATDAGRWRAAIRVDYRPINLGYYDRPEDAARAYDAAARYFFKEFARTNFPGAEALCPAEILQKRKPRPRGQLSRVKNRSGYRGVTWHARDRRWQARIYVNGKTICLGYFGTAEGAARAFDQAARKHFGEAAKTNFPLSDTEDDLRV